MGRHKQMPGRTYRITHQDEQSATVECTYLCPYCNQDTIAQITVPPEGFYLLDRGGFFEPLTCQKCGKITDVRFWHDNRKT